MEIDKQWVERVIKEQDDVEEILDLVVEPAIGENENYGSALFRLKLKIRRKNKEIADTSVILKVKSLKSCSYSAKEELAIFNIENTVYSEVFSEMEKIIKEVGKESEMLWPKYLGHKDLHLLMEDLSVEGFRILPKDKPLDDIHTTEVMRVYGRLHGLGIVLAQRGRVPLHRLRTHFIDGKIMVFPKFYKSGVEGLTRIMKRWGSEWEGQIDEIKILGENIWEKLRDLALRTEEKGPFTTFNHGDCWTNNILFKYNNDPTTPAHIRLVDFQIGHFNSPAWDLTYFFYNALMPQVRYEKMRHLLASYTDSLKSTLSLYSYKGQPPTVDQMIEAVKGLSYYGFLSAVTIWPLLISSTQEGFSLESEKLLDDYPGGPQCVHKDFFYISPQVNELLKEEIKLYMKLKGN